jgi:hypothetical protein
MAESMAPAGIPHIGLSPGMAATIPQPLPDPFQQQSIDAARAEAAPPAPPNLGGMIPPITPQDMTPPITPGNTLGGLTPPITPQNTQGGLGAQIPPITPGNTGPNPGSMIPPITPGNTVDPQQTGSVDPKRALLAKLMANRMTDRASSAGYTTSGVGWPGASSAIFGRQ